jgi:hypothetical protein
MNKNRYLNSSKITKINSWKKSAKSQQNHRAVKLIILIYKGMKSYYQEASGSMVLSNSNLEELFKTPKMDKRYMRQLREFLLDYSNLSVPSTLT